MPKAIISLRITEQVWLDHGSAIAAVVCSECHAVVPEQSFRQHAEWHSSLTIQPILAGEQYVPAPRI